MCIRDRDIPIQHCNDTILKAMNRRDTKADLLALLKKLREKVPGLVLRTSLITGLPYEDEAAFEELASVGFTKEWITAPAERMQPEEIISQADTLLPGGKDYRIFDAEDIVEVRYADI